MGHNYFDFIDDCKDRSVLKWGPCKKENVDSLLRVQWMELGLWELDPKNWEKVKALDPSNDANRDKYTYVVMYKDPNHGMGEWKCPISARIPKNSFKYGLRYDKPFYSPKEEMADAYALFVLENDHFLKFTEKNDVVKAKYEFIQKQFIDTSKGIIKLIECGEKCGTVYFIPWNLALSAPKSMSSADEKSNLQCNFSCQS